jgi:urease accessory protein UreE
MTQQSSSVLYELERFLHINDQDLNLVQEIAYEIGL